MNRLTPKLMHMLLLNSLILVLSAKADSPCPWSHPDIMINSGKFVGLDQNLYFLGTWDSKNPCALVWDKETGEFNQTMVPEDVAVIGFEPLSMESSRYNQANSTEVSINLKNRVIQRTGILYTLDNDFCERYCSLGYSDPLEFTCSDVPFEIKIKNKHYSMISTRTPFSRKDWVLLFNENSKRCWLLEVGWGIPTSFALDSNYLYIGFTHYDETEGCETFRSPGVLKCDFKSGNSQILGNQVSELFDFEVLHMAFWNHSIFIATRQGIAVSTDGVSWVEYKIIVDPKVGSSFKPVLFTQQMKVDQPWDWNIVPCSLGDVDLKMSSDVDILRAASFMEHPDQYFYCINKTVQFFWRSDPEKPQKEHIGRKIQEDGNLSVTAWDTTDLWLNRDQKKPPLTIWWRYEVDPIEISVTPLESGWYEMSVPFCWVSCSLFDLRIQKEH